MTNTRDQQAAIDKLSQLKVGALFMEMGTGKTKTALELIASKAHKIDYILWLCPCAIKHEIAAEKDKWHPELELDVVGVESIGQSDRIYLETRAKMEGKRCFVIVDESLKIKNIKAKRTRRNIDLGKLAEYKLILNGTPLSKNIMDLWTQMEFLSPKILGMTYYQFKDCYTEYYEKGKFKGRITGQANVEHLVSKIKPYIFDAELDIAPAKHYRDRGYVMSYGEEMEYESIKQEIIEEWENSPEDDIDFYKLIGRLQRHYTKAVDKTEELNRIIEEIDDKAVVFVKYLDSIPSGALKITGDMSTEKRAKAIEEFKTFENEKILYITYGCGSFGLNLQFCHHVIFAEHLFDYAQRIQAEARVYRIGQDHDVTYWSLWCDCGLEKLIERNLWKKEGLLDEVKAEIEKEGKQSWLNSL